MDIYGYFRMVQSSFPPFLPSQDAPKSIFTLLRLAPDSRSKSLPLPSAEAVITFGTPILLPSRNDCPGELSPRFFFHTDLFGHHLSRKGSIFSYTIPREILERLEVFFISRCCAVALGPAGKVATIMTAQQNRNNLAAPDQVPQNSHDEMAEDQMATPGARSFLYRPAWSGE